jgi:hypothetical protein
MGQKSHPLALRLQAGTRRFDSAWASRYFYGDLLTLDLATGDYLDRVLRAFRLPRGRLGFAPLPTTTRLAAVWSLPSLARQSVARRFRIPSGLPPRRRRRGPPGMRDEPPDPKGGRPTPGRLLRTSWATLLSHGGWWARPRPTHQHVLAPRILCRYVRHWGTRYQPTITPPTAPRWRRLAPRPRVQSPPGGEDLAIPYMGPVVIPDPRPAEARARARRRRLHRVARTLHRIYGPALVRVAGALQRAYGLAGGARRARGFPRGLYMHYRFRPQQLWHLRMPPTPGRPPRRRPRPIYSWVQPPAPRAAYRGHWRRVLTRWAGTPVHLTPHITRWEWQDAGTLAEEIVYCLEHRVPFRRLKHRLLTQYRRHPWIGGLRITCAGRVGGKSKKAQRAKVLTVKTGQTSLHVFRAPIDFAARTAHTPLGAMGIKVWVAYRGSPLAPLREVRDRPFGTAGPRVLGRRPRREVTRPLGPRRGRRGRPPRRAATS